MTDKLPSELLNTLHNARTQTQAQIQQQNQQNGPSLSRQQDVYQREYHKRQERLKQRHGDPTQRFNLPQPSHDQPAQPTAKTAASKLNTAILQQNQTALNQVTDELTQLQTLINQTNGQIQQAIKRLETDSLALIQTTGEHLRQAILDDQAQTLTLNSQSHQDLRHGIASEHQQTYQVMKDKNLELNKSINIFRLDKMPLTASMGFMSGGIFMITLALVGLMVMSYHEWRGIAHQVDIKNQQLEQITQKIDKSPSEQKLLHPYPSQELSRRGDGRIQLTDQGQYHDHQRQTTTTALANATSPNRANKPTPRRNP